MKQTPLWLSTSTIPLAFRPMRMAMLTPPATSGTARFISSPEINRLRATPPSTTPASLKDTTSPPLFHLSRQCHTPRLLRSFPATVVLPLLWSLPPPLHPPSPPFSSEPDLHGWVIKKDFRPHSKAHQQQQIHKYLNYLLASKAKRVLLTVPFLFLAAAALYTKIEKNMVWC